LTTKFPGDEFHDCIIQKIDFSDWTEKVTFILYCPYAGIDGEYIRFTFYRILTFLFEVSLIGELNPKIRVANIILDESSEEIEKWKRRIEELATPDKNYPEGIRSSKYEDVYHFIFDSVEFRGEVCFPWRDAFQIICRGYQFEPLSEKELKRFKPA